MALINDDQKVDWGIVQRLNNGECTWISLDELVGRFIVASEEWFAGRITRSLAEELVLHPDQPCGSFLVRESLRDMNGKFYALTVSDKDSCSGRRVKHYRIKRDDTDAGFVIIINPIQIKFKTLANLVQHFRSDNRILCCKLTHPALRKTPIPFVLPKRASVATECGSRSCTKSITTPKISTEVEFKQAIHTATEAVRAPLREALCCTICFEVSREPTLCVSCGQLVGCYSCVLTALEHDERCPLCRAAWNRSQLSGFFKSRISFNNIPGL